MSVAAPNLGRSRRRPKADEIAVIEAAYRLDGTEAEWLEGLARVASPLLDEGWGVGASTWDVAPGAALTLRAIAGCGGPEGTAEAASESCRFSSPDISRGIFLSGPCTSLGKAMVAQIPEADPGSQKLLALGIHDGLFVLNADPGGYCSALMAYRPARAVLSRRLVSRWSRVASHLGAAFRVRRALQALSSAKPDAFSGSEAILTPAGRVEHVEGPAEHARKLLAQGVVAMDLARGKLRKHDPDAALDAWKGLVAGRWSLVERVDTDGKRFLVAHKNDPHILEPAAVTLRERQIMAARGRGLTLKLIAYDLGLSSATVSRDLQSGMTKLGLVHEAELVALFSPLPTAPPG